MAAADEEEVGALEAELRAMQAELAERERELAATRARLRIFADYYARTVGERHALLQRLQGARDGAAAPAAAAPAAAAPATAGPARARRPALTERDPTESTRLYRQLARQVHPDLAQDETERALRTRLMTEVNLARETQDLDRAEQLLEDWRRNPEEATDDSAPAVADRLARTARRVRRRTFAVAAELLRLRESNLYLLMGVVEAQRRSGVDILEETAADLDRQIAAVRAEMDAKLGIVPPLGVDLPEIRAPWPLPRLPAPPARGGERLDYRPVIVAAGAGALAALALVGTILVATRMPFADQRAARTQGPALSDTAAAPVPTPGPLRYEVVERTRAESARRTLATVRIVVRDEASTEMIVSTLAQAARAELGTAQVVVVFAYREPNEIGGPFTVGRASLSVDGRGWAGDGVTPDGPDGGAIVGSVARVAGPTIETTAFRVPR